MINKKAKGYTLVELVVTISVIGILAAIAFIGYGSWRSNITISQLKSDLIQASAAMENYRNFHDTYPTSVTQIFTPSEGVSLGGGDFDGTNKYQLTALKNKIFYHIDNVKKTPEVGLGDGIVTPGLVVYLDANSSKSNTDVPGEWINLIDKAVGGIDVDISADNSTIKSFIFTGYDCSSGDCLDVTNPNYYQHTVKIKNPVDQSPESQNWTVVSSIKMNKDSVTNYQELLNFNRSIELSWGPNVVPAQPGDYSKPRIWLNEANSFIYKYENTDLLIKDRWSLLSYTFSNKEDIGKIYSGKDELATTRIKSGNVTPSGLPDYIRVGYKFNGNMGLLLVYDRNFFSQPEIDQNFKALCSIYHYTGCP